MSGKSVCFINLKGGVGKSTLAVAFAEYLAFVREQKVLFIDGDPQCHSTTMLIGLEETKEVQRRHRTLYDLIRKRLDWAKPVIFPGFVINEVSNISTAGEGSVSLLPSSIRFADYEETLFTLMKKDNLSPADIHRKASRVVDTLEERTNSDYDWVVVDCPPSFSMQSRLVTRLARNAVIPTTPDPLSARGTSMVVDRLHGKRMRTKPLCVVISKFRTQSATARRFKDLLLERKSPPVDANWPPILEKAIPEAASIQAVSDFEALTNATTFNRKYKDKAGVIRKMSEEIIEHIELKRTESGRT